MRSSTRRTDQTHKVLMCFEDAFGGQCHYDGQFNCRDACGVDELYKRTMMASNLQACSLAARFSGIGASVPNRHAGIAQAGHVRWASTGLAPYPR